MTFKVSSPAGAMAKTGWAGWLGRHRNLLTGLLLMVAAWALYLPSVGHGFVYYDDVRVLLEHPELFGQAKLSADLHAIFVTGFPREEPLLLRDVTWALDSRIFGFGNAFGYHLNNVLLHGAGIALMFAFLLGTTRRYGFALAVSAAYLIVAIHTEPVAWIMGRKDILSAVFMLLALCAQTRRLTTESNAARCGWYGVTLVCFGCGLLSKISVLTFPLVLFLHAIFLPYLNGERPPNGPLVWGRALAKEILLLVPGLVVSGWVYHWYRGTLTQMGIFDRGYTAHGLGHLWNLLMVDPLAFWVYVRQTFFPWQLNVLYGWPALQPAYSLGQMVISLATVIAAGAVGVWLFCRRKDLCFYFGTFFILMVPYLNLVFIGIWVAERYLYFSVFCLLALAVAAAGAVWRRPQPGWRMGVLAIGAGFVTINLFQGLSYQRAWRNGETLWQYHLTLPQSRPTAYANLAACYYAAAMAQPGTPNAVVSLRKMAVVVDAGLAQFWSDRRQPPPADTYFLFFLQSIVQELNGELEAALTSLLTSDRLHPRFDSTNLNLAHLYRRLAVAAADPQQRQRHARAARERFAEYIALAYRSQPVPPAVQRELAEFEAACSTANQPDKKSGP